jgi:hypothetical protein
MDSAQAVPDLAGPADLPGLVVTFAAAFSDDAGSLWRPIFARGSQRGSHKDQKGPYPMRRKACELGALGGTRTPNHRSVDSRVSVRTRSDWFVTSGSSLPIVRIGSEHPEVVHPCGSQRGSQGRPTPGRW